MAFSSTSTAGWAIPKPKIHVPFAASPANVLATRAEFTACIDLCVRAFIATPPAPTATALSQLRLWLKDDAATLSDGTPIDLALFDDTILSIDERISQTGARTQAQLLRALRQLAESVYAKT
jgi:hypothetical protein